MLVKGPLVYSCLLHWLCQWYVWNPNNFQLRMNQYFSISSLWYFIHHRHLFCHRMSAISSTSRGNSIAFSTAYPTNTKIIIKALRYWTFFGGIHLPEGGSCPKRPIMRKPFSWLEVVVLLNLTSIQLFKYPVYFREIASTVTLGSSWFLAHSWFGFHLTRETFWFM